MWVTVKSFEGESGDGWKGAKLAALCVGVSAYSERSTLSWLGNAVRDAEVMFKKMKDCSNCRAAIMRDPKDIKTILDHLRDFLDQLAALPEEEMPEAVMLIVAGHGKQDGQDVFLIPSDAKSDTREDLETECLSHLTVLEEFNKFANRTPKFFALPSVVSWTTHKHTGVCVCLVFSLFPPQCLPPALINEFSTLISCTHQQRRIS